MAFKDRTFHFFSPLTGRYREMAVSCIRNLYLCLNGPEADYSCHLTRVDVLDTFDSSIRSAPALDDIRLLTDADDPGKAARGFKQNGLVVLNYRIFMSSVSEADLVFGAEARKRALAAQQQQLAEMGQQLELERTERRFHQAFYDAARQMSAVVISKRRTWCAMATRRT